MLHRSFALALFAALALLGSGAMLAQDAGKNGTPEKKAKKDDAKSRPSIDKFKWPGGSILVVVDEIKQALLIPNSVVLTPEKYQELVDRIHHLEKLLKPEKRSVYSCKVTGRPEKVNGKLEDNFMVFTAEFVFTTDQPHTVVPIGLQGGYLVDEGLLDKEVPALEDSEEGFTLKVAQPGTHKLNLNLKVPIGRRGAAAGGERGFDLGLPAASVTNLVLYLPDNIKEIRCNDHAKEKRPSGHWDLNLGTIKNLNVSWKEPIAVPGSEPLLSAEGQIAVKVEESATLVEADLALQDLRGQTKEWHLTLPAKAKVDVKAPGLVFEQLGTDADHIIRFTHNHAERFNVHVQVRYPRPLGTSRLQVGPFLLPSAANQRGMITIHAPAANLRGQRLLFYPYGEVFRRDLPKGPTAQDIVASFYYWNLAGPAKGANPKSARIPLEIEFKTEKGPVETVVEPQLSISHRTAEGLIVDYEARIRVKSFYGGLEFLDVQLPRARVPHIALFAASPLTSFPAAVAWAGLLEEAQASDVWALPARFYADEGQGTAPDLADADAQGKARIKFLRPTANKEFNFVLKGRYLVPAGAQRCRIELPRIVGVLDRGGKVTVSALDPDIELLVGPRGQEEPVAKKHQYQTTLDASSSHLDLTWRPYLVQVLAESVTDITVRGKQAHLRQRLTFPWKRDGKSAHVLLRLPRKIANFKVIAGGKFVATDSDQKIVYVEPVENFPAREDLVLEYDQSLPTKEQTAEIWQVPQFWPDNSTQRHAKVRVWSEPGVLPEVEDREGHWHNRGTELVAGRDTVPALVVQGSSANLDLALRLPRSAPSPLPIMICEGGLVQVTIDETGNQIYRARFLIQKLNTDGLDLILPIPANSCLQSVALNKQNIAWGPSEHGPNAARVPTEPKLFRHNVLLDIEYKVPVEGRHLWQTTLMPIKFHGDVFLGQVRWLVNLPAGRVAVLSGNNLQADFQWAWHGWLLAPEPAASATDAEKWLLGPDAKESSFPVSQAFSHSTHEEIFLVHLPRQTWLLVCSGLLLGATLLLYFAPLARSLYWVVLAGLGLSATAAAFFWPGWMPPLLFGMQPGFVVVALLLTVHWLLQERYRRQVIFMPGFTRLKPGSSLISASASNSRPREASTVDAPPSPSLQGRGSSISPSAPG